MLSFRTLITPTISERKVSYRLRNCYIQESIQSAATIHLYSLPIGSICSYVSFLPSLFQSHPLAPGRQIILATHRTITKVENTIVREWNGTIADEDRLLERVHLVQCGCSTRAAGEVSVKLKLRRANFCTFWIVFCSKQQSFQNRRLSCALKLREKPINFWGYPVIMPDLKVKHIKCRFTRSHCTETRRQQAGQQLAIKTSRL